MQNNQLILFGNNILSKLDILNLRNNHLIYTDGNIMPKDMQLLIVDEHAAKEMKNVKLLEIRFFILQIFQNNKVLIRIPKS